MRTSPQSTARMRPEGGNGGVRPGLLVHRGEELLVGLRALHPLDQEFHRLDRRHVGEEVPEQVDPVELVLVHEELFLAGTGLLDVDGRPDAPVGQPPVEHQLACCRCP